MSGEAAARATHSVTMLAKVETFFRRMHMVCTGAMLGAFAGGVLAPAILHPATRRPLTTIVSSSLGLTALSARDYANDMIELTNYTKLLINATTDPDAKQKTHTFLRHVEEIGESLERLELILWP